MKQLFTLLLLIAFSISNAQNVDLSNLNSVADAEEFIKRDSTVFAFVDYIATTKDSLTYYQSQLQQRAKNENIKFLESKAIVAIKVNYIFFDGTKLSKKAIDSKRKEILSMHQKGISSDDLVAQFTMDHNVKPGGNFGWRDELDVEPTFREAVKKHKKGDVFLVDTPELNWYYVVFKLYDDIEKVAIYYIKVL